MKLYTNSFSPNCRKVYAVEKHLGIELEHEHVDLRAGKQHEPEYLRLNPNGKVPTLVDGDVVLWESNAINAYLAGRQETALWPRSSERYNILRWVFWESNHLSKAVGTIIGQKLFNRENPDQAILESGYQDFQKYAGVLNNALESSSFLTGDTLTLADYSVAVWFGYQQVCELPMDEFGHVTRWLGQVAEAPGGSLLAPPQA